MLIKILKLILAITLISINLFMYTVSKMYNYYPTQFNWIISKGQLIRYNIYILFWIFKKKHEDWWFDIIYIYFYKSFIPSLNIL
jgi:hypothetical protein